VGQFSTGGVGQFYSGANKLLNSNWFRSLEDLRVQAAAWRADYNANHPHSSLGNLSPEEYARRATNITPKAAFSRASVA
jgi:transposase InsO family protein